MSPHDRPPLRFSLAAVIELTAGVGLFFALVTQLGSFGLLVASVAFVTYLLISHVVLAGNDPNGLWNEAKSSLLLVLALPLFLMLLFGLSLLQDGRGPHRTTECLNDIKTLMVAFHNYHDEHGHFPPPYIADANGKPMHSWRVLILPYIEEQSLYKAYNFNEP